LADGTAISNVGELSSVGSSLKSSGSSLISSAERGGWTAEAGDGGPGGLLALKWLVTIKSEPELNGKGVGRPGNSRLEGCLFKDGWIGKDVRVGGSDGVKDVWVVSAEGMKDV